MKFLSSRPPTWRRPGERRGISVKSFCPRSGRTSRGLDVEDLELQRPARRRDLDRLALLVAEDRAADGRLLRELVLRRVRFGGADDVVLDGLVRVDVLQAHVRPDRDDIGGDLRLL